MADANSGLYDRWTPVHVATGVASGALGLTFTTSMLLAVAYEAVEYAHEWPRGSVLFGSKRPETPVNVASDLAVFALGWWLGRKVTR